jgi:hypothetical protein
MLDAVVETTRALTLAPVKKVVEAATTHTETEAGPSVPAEMKLAATEQRAEEESPDTGVALEKSVAKEAKSPAPEAPSEGLDYIIRHDFLYCLSDNKELSVCREMAKSMGFSKLEAGLCAMTKADLADSLTYNSLKVQKL